VNLSA